MNPHVGITVSSLSRSKAFYERMGFSMTYEATRGEPWIGVLVGVPGALIRICHMGHTCGMNLELLQYMHPSNGSYMSSIERGPASRVGTVHFAVMVDDMESLPRDQIRWIGTGEIPDGPYAGTRCAYIRGLDGEIVELFQAPA